MALLGDDLIAKARSITLLEYMEQNEPSSIKRSAAGRYVHKDHDSFVIDNGKGQWFWNSKSVGGFSAIDYLERVEGMNFRTAVLHLTGGEDNVRFSNANQSSSRQSPVQQPPVRHPHMRQSTVQKPLNPSNNVTAALDELEKQEANKPFRLPNPGKTNTKVINYLNGRGIDKATIQQCISRGLLYESDKGNCVFVGRDKTDGNKAKYAAERSTYGSSKKDVAGSDKQFGFCIPPENPNPTVSTNQNESTSPNANADQNIGMNQKANTNPNTNPNAYLAIFESPIDAMSHKDLLSTIGNDWDGHRLSLGGVVSKALDNFLEQNPGITHIWLCLDKDKAGHEANKRIIGELLQDPRHKNIKVTVSIPPLGKDWSESLVAVRQMQRDISHNQQKQAAQVQSRPKQDAFSL